MKLFPLAEEHYFKLHGRPETPALLENAREWLKRANLLLGLAFDAGVELPYDQVSGNYIASGYRPAGINATTANAAVASTHLTCEGDDVQDNQSRALAQFCVLNEGALVACHLWMEDPRWTGGRERPDGEKRDPWCHWQTKPPRSGNRIYVPSTQPPSDPHFYERNGLLIPSYLK